MENLVKLLVTSGQFASYRLLGLMIYNSILPQISLSYSLPVGRYWKPVTGNW